MLAVSKDSCITHQHFALLNHIHDEVMARLVVKVVLHDKHRIPPDVVISTGYGRGTKSWIVVIYVLSCKDLVVPPYEQPIPPHGLALYLPPNAPRQMDPVGDVARAAHSELGEASIGMDHDNPAHGGATEFAEAKKCFGRSCASYKQCEC